MFTCECCQYKTDFKSNYGKHVKSKKHVINSNKLAPVTSENESIKKVSESQHKVIPKSTQSQPCAAAAYSCKYCDQSFKFKQSMYRHIKYSCTKNQDEDLKELVRLLNLQLESERKERENVQKQLHTQARQLHSQAKQIEKLMGKLEIHGSFNNNTINNITLLAYRNTDVTHLTTEDYIGIYKKVNHCVKQLIEKIHFNPEKPENMNIYISNMKDKYITVYDGSNWNLANKTEELERLYEEKERMLEEWLETNPNPVLKEKFMRYLKNKESADCLPYIMEEIKLMLYNKGNQLIKKEA
jgi:hypothetical protein